jgi:3-oxoacyl-[acyl-carrier protein] reductase
MAVNVKGPFLCSRAAASSLRRAGGAIVNVSSVAGMFATGAVAAVRVSKAALTQLTRHARARPCHGVAPGVAESPCFGHLVGDERAKDVYEAAKAATPLGHTLEPPDVSQIVLSLLVADAVTGETLDIDGGRAITD